jgi:hypothetical protein
MLRVWDFAIGIAYSATHVGYRAVRPYRVSMGG